MSFRNSIYFFDIMERLQISSSVDNIKNGYAIPEIQKSALQNLYENSYEGLVFNNAHYCR